MQRQLTIRIRELVVDSNGDFPGTKPSHNDDLGLRNNSLMASLTYPRSGASQVLSVKQYDLEDGKPARLVDEDNPSPFFDPLLFREDVQDQTVLNIKVTNLDESGKAEKFFLTLLGTIFGAGASVVTGGLSTVIGAIVGFGVDQLRGGIGSAGNAHIDTIGTAQLPISMDAYSAEPIVRVIELIAPQTIERSGFVRNPQPGQQPIQKTIAVTTKGKSNGRLTLEISAT
jgi:hypothetical protein